MKKKAAERKPARRRKTASRTRIGRERKYELTGLAFTAAGLLSLCGLFGFNAGFAGVYFARFLQYLFGIGAVVISLLILLIGWRYLSKHQGLVYSLRFWGLGLLFLFLLAVWHHFVIPAGAEILPDSLLRGGGLMGGGLLLCLRKLFGMDGSMIFLGAGMIGSILLSTTWSLAAGLLKTRKTAGRGASAAGEAVYSACEKAADVSGHVEECVRNTVRKTVRKTVKNSFYDQEHDERFTGKGKPAESWTRRAERSPARMDSPYSSYELPKIAEILPRHISQKNEALTWEIEENARILQDTLTDFKVKATIVNACHGPAVTRYEVEPAPGVKVSKITGLADDIALRLAAAAVRIEQIPGKSAIGIEVPNKELEGVPLRDVLETRAFDSAKSCLTAGIGMDISGQAVLADLAKMPHLLVAGATGSGKSVCINTLLASILFKARPDEVKFILIDPKMVELSVYDGIPHLLAPVVTEPERAALVLNWLVQEMEKRYAVFAGNNVRNIESYNRKFSKDKMPAVVIIIDELADLMMAAPHEVEEAVCRLAQKARAAGIHMILATQRPSADVITGSIKANIPSRISFAVSSQIDSRTILDRSGAEKLLGNGDMLFYPVDAAKPLRVQGAFIREDELENLLDFIRSQGQTRENNEELAAFMEKAMAEKAAEGEGRSRKMSGRKKKSFTSFANYDKIGN